MTRPNSQLLIQMKDMSVTAPSSLQVENYWATQRQNLALLEKAEKPDYVINQVRRELSDILEQSLLIYPPTLNDLGLYEEMSYIEKQQRLDIWQTGKINTPREQRFLNFMKENADKGRKATWRWRVIQEMESKKDWYPFFVTLTLDPTLVEKHYPSCKEFWQQGKEFRLWKRKIVKTVCRQLGHPPAHKKTKKFPYRPESDYMTYFGVIEHGKSREHHHMHLLVWLREIPNSWKQDPNRYIRDPQQRTRVKCSSLSGYWKWSLPAYSCANYFRTKGDVWSRLDKPFGYPIDKNTLQPMQIGDISQGANYVIKYLQKGHKEWNHRVKATRNLGLKKIKEVIKSLPQAVTEALTWRPLNSSLHHLVSLTHSAPLVLVRSEAKRRHFSNLLEAKSLDLTMLLQKNYNSFTKMLRSVRDGARPDRMPSQDLYDWVSQHLPAPNGYCELRLLEANQALTKYFPKPVRKINPITQAANNGFTLSIQNRSTQNCTRKPRIFGAT